MGSNFRVVYIPASKANSTTLGAGLTEATQWIAQNIDDWSRAKPSVPFIDVFGSDCKLLGLDDNKQVMLTFTRPHHPGAQSVTYFAELFVRHKTSESTSEVSLVIEDVIDTTFKPDTTVAKSVRVLTGTTGDTIDSSVPAAVTSKCPWQHGRPRGSTPALLLPNGQYLGIFHSYDQLSRDQIISTCEE
eukprot:gene11489-13355_t